MVIVLVSLDEWRAFSIVNERQTITTERDCRALQASRMRGREKNTDSNMELINSIILFSSVGERSLKRSHAADSAVWSYDFS